MIFSQNIKGLENEKEGVEKGVINVIESVLKKLQKKLKKIGYEYFTTVLSISPMKNAQWINEIGEELGKEYGIKFLMEILKRKAGI